MAYVAITSDLHGHIFSIDHAGDLHRNWHRNTGSGPLVHHGLGERIGSGWHGILHLAATRVARRLLVAGVHTDGTVHAAHTDIDAVDQWSNVVPTPDGGAEWKGLAALSAGQNGALYGVSHAGELHQRAYVNPAGQPPHVLEPNVKLLSSGWGVNAEANRRVTLFTNGSRFFDITIDGELRYHPVVIGSSDIPDAGWIVLSGGWLGYQRVFAGGPNRLYAIGSEGDLVVHHIAEERDVVRLLPRARAARVSTGIVGWSSLPCAMEGYATPQCGKPGDVISFHTAARCTGTTQSMPSTFTVEYFRLRRPWRDGIIRVDDEKIPHDNEQERYRSEQRALPDGWLLNGMQWPTTFTFRIPDKTRSGLCAARCTDEQGHSFYIPFIVKPERRSAPFAVLANTNTWNTYNSWGGHGKYVRTYPLPTTIPFERPHPGLTPDIPFHNATCTELFNQSNHLLRAELWVLGWLDSLGEKYAYDLYIDRDLHDGIPGLSDPDPGARYKALILTVHPEYWTAEMYDAAMSYQKLGGSILYLGGNGIYEEVLFLPSGVGLAIFPGVDWNAFPKDVSNEVVRLKCLWRDHGKPERALIGVGFENPAGPTLVGQPYQLKLNPDQSPALHGLPLAVGDKLGDSSANPGFSADGWEVDQRGADTPDAANAANALLGLGRCAVMSGEMLYYETDPSGKQGVVFAGSSLSFGGSLAADPNLQLIVQNVLDITLRRQSSA